MKYGLDTSVILRVITGEPPALAEKVDAHIAEAVANGFVSVSREKDFRKLDFTEDIA